MTVAHLQRAAAVVGMSLRGTNTIVRKKKFAIVTTIGKIMPMSLSIFVAKKRKIYVAYQS